MHGGKAWRRRYLNWVWIVLEKLENNEFILLMYLADELPAEDKAEVDQLLATDRGLRAQWVELRAAQSGFSERLGAAGRGIAAGVFAGGNGSADRAPDAPAPGKPRRSCAAEETRASLSLVGLSERGGCGEHFGFPDLVGATCAAEGQPSSRPRSSIPRRPTFPTLRSSGRRAYPHVEPGRPTGARRAGQARPCRAVGGEQC